MAHKNLSYESKEPAFLQRLRAQTAGVYQERPLNRPKKQRNPEDDEEDEPVYVLEDNTTLSSKEFEALKGESENPKASEDHTGESEGGSAEKPSTTDSKDTKDRKSGGSVLEIGGKTQKRKIGKIIGADASDKEDEIKKKEEEAPKKKKPKSKQKVKLSFGDD